MTQPDPPTPLTLPDYNETNALWRALCAAEQRWQDCCDDPEDAYPACLKVDDRHSMWLVEDILYHNVASDVLTREEF
jgi:hypothetical protein